MKMAKLIVQKKTSRICEINIEKNNGTSWQCISHDISIPKTPHDIAGQAQRIAIWLESVEDSVFKNGKESREEFYGLFSDTTYVLPESVPEPENIFKFPNDEISKNNDKVYLAGQKFLLFSAIFKGLYQYLKNEDHYKKNNAYLLLFYSCWQWYCLIKEYISKNSKDCSKDKTWVNLMATAFQELSQLLDNGDLERNGTIEKFNHTSDSDDIVYRMRIQCILAPQTGISEYHKVIFEPKEIYKKEIDWDSEKSKNDYSIKLHPVFEFNSSATAAARAFVTEDALKNYDFETTLKLANMLSGKRRSTGRVSMWVALLAFLIISISFTLFLPLLIFSILNIPYIAFHIPFGFYFLVPALLSLIFIFTASHFDRKLLPRLFLPRMLGGVFIGFSVLVVAGDSIPISHTLWSRGPCLIIMFWIVVLLICYFYICSEIKPRVNDAEEVKRRTVQTICVFIFSSLTIGIFILAIPTAAFFQLVLPSKMGMILGPIGWVDFQLWLSYTPIALFLGIVTQFLFEDKTITESVWPVEKG